MITKSKSNLKTMTTAPLQKPVGPKTSQPTKTAEPAARVDAQQLVAAANDAAHAKAHAARDVVGAGRSAPPPPALPTTDAALDAIYADCGDGLVAPAQKPEFDVVAHVRDAGAHGFSVAELENVGDTSLLQLQTLLDPAPEKAIQRINALSAIASAGGEVAQAFARDYIVNSEKNLDVQRYGLWALGRGQNRQPTAATMEFLQAASRDGFWSTQSPSDAASLAAAAQSALGMVERE